MCVNLHSLIERSNLVKHKTLFLASSIVCLIYGLLWFVLPVFTHALFGRQVGAYDTGSIMARYFGSALLGLTVATFMARKANSDSIAVRGLIYGGFILSVTSFVTALIDAFLSDPNNMVWVSAAILLVFSIWFGMFVFKKSA
jgi:fluoride ion exporter CrcB/FEX